MTPLEIANEETVPLWCSHDVVVAAAREGRRGLVLQLLGPGVVWVKFTGPASRGDGICLKAMEIYNFPQGFMDPPGLGDENYEGEVHAYHENIGAVVPSVLRKHTRGTGRHYMRVVEIT